MNSGKKVLFVGLNDWMIRNLLRSSFPKRSKELGLQLHAFVYQESYPVFKDILLEELGMTSEPFELLKPEDVGVTEKYERKSDFANLVRAVKNKNESVFISRLSSSNLPSIIIKSRIMISKLKGFIGLIFGRETPNREVYWSLLRKCRTLKETCIPKLRDLEPNLIINASPETFYGVLWMMAADELGIKTANWIRSWDNVTTKGNAFIPSTFVYVWSKWMEQEYRKFFAFEGESRITCVGSLQFDRHLDSDQLITREEFCTLTGLDPLRPILLYTTGGPHILPNEHLVINEIIDRLAKLNHPSNPQLLIRLHPYFWNTDLDVINDVKDVAVWPRQEDAPNMEGEKTTGLLDDYKVMLSSFYHQAVNINVASTVTLDSAIYDKPIVNIAFDGKQKLPVTRQVGRYYKKFIHYIKIVESDSVVVVWNIDECMSGISDALDNPERQQEGRKKMLEMQCGEIDGNSGRLLAEAISRDLG